MRAVCVIPPRVTLLTDRYPQVKTLVSTSSSGALCHLRRPRTARSYSGTRMDTVWADRQAFVISVDTPTAPHSEL